LPNLGAASAKWWRRLISRIENEKVLLRVFSLSVLGGFARTETLSFTQSRKEKKD